MASEFGFGEVYFESEAKNGTFFPNSTNVTITSEYFENTNPYTTENFVFATNYYGIGLPDANYMKFSSLLFNLTSNASCSTGRGGFCKIASNCNDVTNFTALAF